AVDACTIVLHDALPICQIDDEVHQLFNHRIGRSSEVTAQLALLPCRHDGTAQKQGNDDDLQHIVGTECLPHVAGENGHDGSHQRSEEHTSELQSRFDLV